MADTSTPQAPGNLFVRFQSPAPNARGHYSGTFALANGLARAGILTPDQYRYWRTNNDWYDNNLPHPPPPATTER